MCVFYPSRPLSKFVFTLCHFLNVAFFPLPEAIVLYHIHIISCLKYQLTQCLLGTELKKMNDYWGLPVTTHHIDKYIKHFKFSPRPWQLLLLFYIWEHWGAEMFCTVDSELVWTWLCLLYSSLHSTIHTAFIISVSTYYVLEIKLSRLCGYEINNSFPWRARISGRK